MDVEARSGQGQETIAVTPPLSGSLAIGAVSAQKQAGRGPYTLYTWDISKPAIQAIQDGYASGVLWIQVYKAGESFFEPPGSSHLVSENASQTEPASLIAVFVADDGATLTLPGAAK